MNKTKFISGMLLAAILFLFTFSIHAQDDGPPALPGQDDGSSGGGGHHTDVYSPPGGGSGTNSNPTAGLNRPDYAGQTNIYFTTVESLGSNTISLTWTNSGTNLWDLFGTSNLAPNVPGLT